MIATFREPEQDDHCGEVAETAPRKLEYFTAFDCSVQLQEGSKVNSSLKEAIVACWSAKASTWFIFRWLGVIM